MMELPPDADPRTLGASSAPAAEGCCGDAEDARDVLVEDAIAAIGVGRFQRWVCLLCGLAVTADGVEKAALMYIIKGVEQSWDVRGEWLGLFAAASGLGQSIGSIAFGRWSDVKGRRHGLIAALAATFVLGGLCTLAPNFPVFVLLRFLVNIALGGALPCAFTLLAEFLPTRERATWIPFLYTTYGVGRLLTAALAWGLLQYSWRLYLLAIALPCGSLLLMQRWLPESPHFLAARGRLAEARAVLETIAAANGTAPPLGPRARLCAEVPPATKEGSCTVLQTRSSQVLCVMWLLVALGTEWFNWVIKVLEESGVPESATYSGLVFFNTNELVVPLLLALTGRATIGERPRCAVGTVSALALVSLAAFAAAVALALPPRSLLALSVAASYCGIGVWVLHYTVTPNYFPAEVRGTGLGTCMTFNRLGYIIGPLVGAALVESERLLLLALCAACYIVLIALTALLGLPPEACSADAEDPCLADGG